MQMMGKSFERRPWGILTELRLLMCVLPLVESWVKYRASHMPILPGACMRIDWGAVPQLAFQHQPIRLDTPLQYMLHTPVWRCSVRMHIIMAAAYSSKVFRCSPPCVCEEGL